MVLRDIYMLITITLYLIITYIIYSTDHAISIAIILIRLIFFVLLVYLLNNNYNFMYSVYLSVGYTFITAFHDPKLDDKVITTFDDYNVDLVETYSNNNDLFPLNNLVFNAQKTIDQKRSEYLCY